MSENNTTTLEPPPSGEDAPAEARRGGWRRMLGGSGARSLGLVIALALLALKVVSLHRLVRIGLPVPRAAD